MKYLVMECHEDYVVLLDEEAGFVKAKNTGLTVGETLEDPHILQAAPTSRRNIIRKVTYGLAAAAACLAVGFGVEHYQEYVTPYSNIRLSINPDVEMTLNHHGQVLSLEGLNEDGKELIEGYEPKRQDKLAVADDLIERAIDMGYLSDDTIIIFDIDTPDKELLTQYGIELRSEAEIYTKEFANINIIIIDRNEEKKQNDDADYNDQDYEPIVIPIPQQTEAVLPETNPADSGYAEADDGSEDEPDDGDSGYGEMQTEVNTTPPPAAVPPVQNAVGDSGYDTGSDSSYGDSSYDAESDYD